MLCMEFSQRQFTFERDVLNALSSTTTALARSFPGGFSYDLPEYAFILSPLWTDSFASAYERRHWLPSWPWIGWEGYKSFSYHRNVIVHERQDHHHYDAEYHRPISRWIKRHTLTSALVAINDTFHRWEEHAENLTARLPEGWSFDHEEGSRDFVHDILAPKLSETRSHRPVPIAE